MGYMHVNRGGDHTRIDSQTSGSGEPNREIGEQGDIGVFLRRLRPPLLAVGDNPG